MDKLYTGGIRNRDWRPTPKEGIEATTETRSGGCADWPVRKPRYYGSVGLVPSASVVGTKSRVVTAPCDEIAPRPFCDW